MRDERLERNWKMANAASDHVMRPPNEQYRSNYDAISWVTKPALEEEAPKQAEAPDQSRGQ